MDGGIKHENDEMSNFEGVQTERNQSERNEEENISEHFQRIIDDEGFKLSFIQQFSRTNSESIDCNEENQLHYYSNRNEKLHINKSTINLEDNIDNFTRINLTNIDNQINLNNIQINSNQSRMYLNKKLRRKKTPEKELKNDQKKHDARLESLKGAAFQFEEFLKKYGGIKLEKVNYNGIFGGIKKNQEILNKKMKEIFEIDTENLEFQDANKKNIFNFFCESKYKFLYKNYFLMNRTFNIEGEDIYIRNFPTLYDELNRRINKFYNNEKYGDVIEKVKKIKKFIFGSYEVFNDFKNINSRQSRNGGKKKKEEKNKTKFKVNNIHENTENFVNNKNVMDDFIFDICNNIEKETNEKEAKEFIKKIEKKISVM